MRDYVIARVCYDSIKALNESVGDYWMVPWGEASQNEKNFFIKGVQEVWGAGCDAKAAHEIWMKNRLSEGWSRGPKNTRKQTHPSLIPFSKLSQFEKAKDHIFAAIVKNLKPLPDR